MKTRWFCLLGVLLLLWLHPVLAQEATPELTPSTDDLSALFAYDQDIQLDIHEVGVTDQDGIAIHDITFASPVADTNPVAAYLVVPPGDGPFAGAVFVHWLGNVKSNREEFLDDALLLAQKGVVSLLLDAAWAHGGVLWNRDLQHDRDASIKQVIDIRRAVDVLVAQPGIDVKRLALVGHDFGSMYSAIVLGVDHRFKAAVLMAGTIRLTDWFIPYGRGPKLAGDELNQYMAALSVFDGPLYVANANPTTLLFQFSRGDNYVPEETALAFYLAASRPRRLELYDTDHALRLQDVTDARIKWLSKVLNLQ